MFLEFSVNEIKIKFFPFGRDFKILNSSSIKAEVRTSLLRKGFKISGSNSIKAKIKTLSSGRSFKVHNSSFSVAEILFKLFFFRILNLFKLNSI